MVKYKIEKLGEELGLIYYKQADEGLMN